MPADIVTSAVYPALSNTAKGSDAPILLGQRRRGYSFDFLNDKRKLTARAGVKVPAVALHWH